MKCLVTRAELQRVKALSEEEFFFCHTHGLWKFLGQGLNPHHSSDTRSLTWCTTRELQEEYFKMQIFFFFFFFVFSRAAPTAYGDFQARGLIGAVATGLCQSHSNEGSELCLQPTPQLTSMPDP